MQGNSGGKCHIKHKNIITKLFKLCLLYKQKRLLYLTGYILEVLYSVVTIGSESSRGYYKIPTITLHNGN